MQAGSGGAEAVARDSAAQVQREHPGFARHDRRAGGIQAGRRGHAFAYRPDRGLGKGRAQHEAGAIAVDDKQIASARRCGERRRGGVVRVVDQGRERSRNLGWGRQPQRRRCRIAVGVHQGHRGAERHGGGTQRYLHAKLVAHAQGAGHTCTRRACRRGNGRQGPGWRYRVGRRERTAGAIDDKHLGAFGHGRDIGLRLGVDGACKACRDLGQGRQAQPGGGRIAVGVHQGDPITRRTGGQAGTRAKRNLDLPGLALHRGTGQVQCVGTGAGHRCSGTDGTDCRMDHLRHRERGREDAAAALDDDQQAAVANRGEVG